MLINNEPNTFVRISDFLGVIPAITGKIELVYEGELEGPAKVANILISKSIKSMLLQFFPDPEKSKKSKAPNPYSDIINWFGTGNTLSVVDDLPNAAYIKLLKSVPGLAEVVKQFHPNASGNQQLLFMEFVLHGLSEFSQLNKNFLDNGFTFSDMFNSLFNMEADGDEDNDFDEDRY
jgi:magnesium chelatase subunit I